MKDKTFLYVYSGIVLLQSLFCAQSGLGQGLDGANIGGIVEPTSMKEPYGINSGPEPAVGGNEFAAQGQGNYVTRNYRRGNESGIGSSFMQTNSPTNQSSPARQRYEISPVVQEIAPMPKEVRSIYGKQEATPALQSEQGTQYLMPLSEQVSPALNASSGIPPAGEADSKLFDKSMKMGIPLQHLNLHKNSGASNPEFFFPGP